MKRTLLAALALATLGTTPTFARTDVDIVLSFGPPPVRYEYVPAPRHGSAWVPGYWDWRNRRHVWVAGHHVRERPGYYWREGRWHDEGGRWRLSRPGWQSSRDRDRDGVPDYRDRYVQRPADRDRDGVPNWRDRDPNNPYRN